MTGTSSSPGHTPICESQSAERPGAKFRSSRLEGQPLRYTLESKDDDTPASLLFPLF
ncbi:hypothetical protein PEX1_076650 [Penicillium expansum]|uniref:Uncharacterized protein n=1 Tax=Penicillium expansum TaxID=27334 RepID=A0A0A2JQE5_PENEN|nr:hypothetical protein PEX2_018480 [Penicillium expansum]KGO46791.1 hypothetical protein PEXP_064810 [Penicillium expansum]KGO54480.1 hypothetical protein PEX1_076650 [Penicillium expansum]KGO62441.1 hypothetical protein PEX2_018480 [Penicillium expansum]